MKLNSNLKSIPCRFLQTSYDRLIVRFSKDSLKEITSKQGSSFNLEVISKGKLGYAYSNQLDEKYLKDNAITSAYFGDRVKYSYPKKQKALYKPKLYSEKIIKLDGKYFIDLGKYLIDCLKKSDPNILTDVYLLKSKEQFYLENSEGLKIAEKETSLQIYTQGELVNDGDILTIGEEFNWRDLRFDKKDYIYKLKSKFESSKKVVSLDSGDYEIIFTPESLPSILQFLVTALSAQTIEKKVSKWFGSLGKQVTDKRVSIIDNPTIDFAEGSTSYDDEGTPTNTLNLIENGVLKNFYTDLKCASKLNILPNGRGFGIPATPDVTNLIILGGEKTSSDMIRGLKKGILLYSILGGGQDSPYAGDFSLNIHLGFLVENGEIVGRIKNCMIAGNVFDMFKDKINMISQDVEWVEGSLSTPHISFLDMRVVGK